MPSVSASQQRLFGMVRAYQSGKLSKAPGKIKNVAKHISGTDAKHFAQTKHRGLPEHVKKADFDMNKQAFERGFLKAAMSNGVDILTATQLLKHAESSWIGRYLAEKAIPTSANIDQPCKSMAGALPGIAINEGLLGPARIPTILGIGNPLAEAGAAAMYGNSKNREKKYQEAAGAVDKRTLGANMHHAGKKTAIPYGILGALAGGALGAAAPYAIHNLPGVHYPDYQNISGPNAIPTALSDRAIAGGELAGAGAIGGGALGYGIGALSGGINSAVIHNTSDETKQRATAMKAKHPFMTSLPFGDMIGAAAA